VRLHIYPIILFFAATLVIGCAARETAATPVFTETATMTPKSGPVYTATAAPPAPVRSTPAATIAPYYEGKTVELLVGASAGGGNDTFGRVIATYMPKYIPGNPKMIVRNVAGAGGRVAVSSFAEKVKADGLTLFVGSAATLNIPLDSKDLFHYDATKFEYIGNTCRVGTVIMVKKDALARLTDPGAKPVYLGSQAGNDPWAAMPLFGQEFLGWNIKWILGFGGMAEIELAMRRGEIDMFGTGVTRTVQALVDEGTAVALVQEGILANGRIVRAPGFTDIPVFEEVLGAKKPSGLPWQAYRTWTAASFLDKIIAAPPGTPSNVMAILNDGYKQMSRDRQFDEAVKKWISPVYSMGFGQEVATVVKDMLASSAEVSTYISGLQRKFGVISSK